MERDACDRVDAKLASRADQWAFLLTELLHGRRGSRSRSACASSSSLNLRWSPWKEPQLSPLSSNFTHTLKSHFEASRMAQSCRTISIVTRPLCCIRNLAAGSVRARLSPEVSHACSRQNSTALPGTRYGHAVAGLSALQTGRRLTEPDQPRSTH